MKRGIEETAGGAMMNQNKRFAYGQQNMGGGYGPGVGNDSQYADAVKAGQRSSPNFKTAWHQFCEMNGSQTFDPAKHPVDFVQSFFDAIGQAFLKDPILPGTASPAQNPQRRGNFGGNHGMQAGGYNNQGGFQQQGGYQQRRQYGGVVGGGSTALTKCMEMVKQGQRSSPEWKQRWIEFCSECGNGIQDPGRHDAIFIVSFVMKFGLADVVNANWANPYLVSLGELAKPLMVRTIKKGQTNDDLWRESWQGFSEGKGTGRDPNLHDAGSLMEFFDTVAIPQFSHMPYMQPYVLGTFDAEGTEGVN